MGGTQTDCVKDRQTGRQNEKKRKMKTEKERKKGRELDFDLKFHRKTNNLILVKTYLPKFSK